jgi:hypothetical protein
MERTAGLGNYEQDEFANFRCLRIFAECDRWARWKLVNRPDPGHEGGANAETNHSSRSL